MLKHTQGKIDSRMQRHASCASALETAGYHLSSDVSAGGGHVAASREGDAAPQDQSAANGNGHSLAEDQHEEGSGDDAPQEEAGEETEISDYDEHTHDGEPASSGGAGTGSGLRPSYGRKVCSLIQGWFSTYLHAHAGLSVPVCLKLLGQCLHGMAWQSTLHLCPGKWATA